jgi:hypothetical protein
MMHSRFDRREFLRTLGMAAGGLMLGTGCHPESKNKTTVSAVKIREIRESLKGSLLLSGQPE